MSGGGGSPSPFGGTDPLGDLGASLGRGAGEGTNGSGSGAGGGPIGGVADLCSALTFVARLRSVDPNEVALIDVGEELAVSLFSADRPQIGAFRQTAGGLAPGPVGVLLERIVELLPCLQVVTFVATVVAIDGGSVTVSVAAA